jgi:WD40 repeat protein
MAGTGKSTIARTVAYRFHENGRLGASFFFSKGKKDLGDATAFFTTLAVQLTEALPDLKCYVCDAITKHGDIGQQPLLNQWERLILQPLLMLDKRLPPPLVLILVVDALDECESDEGPSVILRLLTELKELKILRVRVFVTSRPETPILLGFREMTEIAHYDLMLHSVPQKVIGHDISIFVRHELVKINRKRSLEKDWPSEEDIQMLVQRAGRLFIYAATACRFLGKSQYPKKRLSEMLLINSASHSSTKELDEMYMLILKNLITEGQDEDNEDVTSFFKQIVGSIIILFDSLSATALTRLLAVDEINATLEPLRSVLNVPEDETSPVQLFHLSFRDFLLDKNRCPDTRFLIDEKTAHNNLFICCLNLMSKNLRRDMCELRLPGALAVEVEKSKVEGHVPPEVQYACRHWLSHLQRCDISLNEIEQVHKFLQEHLLHWIEALSLIGNMFDGVVIVRTLESMLIVSDSISLRDNLLANLVQPISNKASLLLAMIKDAKRFILYNKSIIEKAPLQVYASALVFTPMQSVIRKQFSSQGPLWIKINSTMEENWSPCLQTLEGHTNWVSSVTFSHDGQRLASGSSDTTVRIWDAETGALQQTLEGHAGWVRSVAFSHDGRRLASGSDDKTVRIWDAETGALQQTLEGHAGRVYTRGFYTGGVYNNGVYPGGVYTGGVHSVTFSYDGQRLASGSDDAMVRIWDVKTGALQQTLEGHTNGVMSVTFSHDDQRLASGSSDTSVRIWDAETGALQQTLEGHTGEVSSVTFSHDGRRLASSSTDKTVRIWDAKMGALQQTLKGYTSWVFSVTFSPDGRRLASGSGDTLVWIWDAEIGALQQTLEGHTDGVYSVTVSHDGRWLASGSSDKTVRIWDAETGVLQQTLEGHTGGVYSVMFSHDGRRLASGSDDETVQIWDAETGALQQTLEGHTNRVWSVTFSHDGRRLASGSIDATVRIWDAETGALQQTLEIGRSLKQLSFSPDDLHLITDLGSITLNQLSSPLVQMPSWLEYCLGGDRSWITWNGINVLLLPSEYRPLCSMVREQTLAMGYTSGRVRLFEFKIKVQPTDG